MSFLDDSAALDGTVLTESDLALARDHLGPLFAELSSKGKRQKNWIDSPEGQLGKLWIATIENRQLAQCKLIYLSKLIKTLTARTSPNCNAILLDKVRSLLYIKDYFRFEESIIELEFADSLVQKYELEFEPLASGAGHDKSNLHSSPDLGIKLISGYLLVELTVFRMKALDEWHQSADNFFGQLTKSLALHQIKRHITLTLSLDARNSLYSNVNFKQLARSMASSEYGTIDLKSPPNVARVRWQPRRNNSLVLSMSTNTRDNELVVTEYSVPKDIRGSLCERLIRTVDNEKILTDSLRNTLRGKCEQLRRSGQTGPACLFITIPQTHLYAPELMAMAARMVFSNRDFSRISALGVFYPRIGFRAADSMASTLMHINPIAKYPIIGLA